MFGRMNVRPLHDRIIVRRSDATSQSKGGIIIPDAAKEKPVQGSVISVGSGKRLETGELVPLDVKAGDKVLFPRYSGSEVMIEGVEHMILREDDILGIIED